MAAVRRKMRAMDVRAAVVVLVTMVGVVVARMHASGVGRGASD